MQCYIKYIIIFTRTNSCDFSIACETRIAIPIWTIRVPFTSSNITVSYFTSFSNTVKYTRVKFVSFLNKRIDKFLITCITKLSHSDIVRFVECISCSISRNYVLKVDEFIGISCRSLNYVSKQFCRRIVGLSTIQICVIFQDVKITEFVYSIKTVVINETVVYYTDTSLTKVNLNIDYFVIYYLANIPNITVCYNVKTFYSITTDVVCFEDFYNLVIGVETLIVFGECV